MVKQCFKLKPSRMAIMVQLSLLLGLLILFYSLLPLGLWLLCSVIGLISYSLFLKTPRPVPFEYLDAEEWTLQFCKAKHLDRVVIRKIIDHQLYIVIYFQKNQVKPLVIWSDQLSLVYWKKLKMLAQLH